MKKSPKVLFSSVHKAKNKTAEIRPFRVGEEYVNDCGRKCLLLIDQCKSEFSTRTTENIDAEIFIQSDENYITDVR